MMVTNQVVDEIKNIVVSKIKPGKIILFGSCARDNTEPHDIDLFIIKESNLDIDARIIEINSLLPDRYPIDVIVYTPEEYEKYKDNKWSFLYRVVREGKIIYERE